VHSYLLLDATYWGLVPQVGHTLHTLDPPSSMPYPSTMLLLFLWRHNPSDPPLTPPLLVLLLLLLLLRSPAPRCCCWTLCPQACRR
jgi:hypothetical protein